MATSERLREIARRLPTCRYSQVDLAENRLLCTYDCIYVGERECGHKENQRECECYESIASPSLS